MQRLFLEFVVRAALIAVGTAAVLKFLRVKTAGARHAAWASVVVLMLMLPVWTAWGPKAPLRVLPAIGAPGASRVIAPATAPSQDPLAQKLDLESSRPAPRSPALNWWTCMAGLYLFGVAMLLSRLAIGTLRAHLLIRRAANRDGRLTSSSCAAPVTMGWLRPTVILPECWPEWPPKQLGAVLAHEREHARRRDPLVQWLALLNRALFWFHPLAWWLERRLSGLAEEACDAAVLEGGHDPYEYSEWLLEMARSVVRSGARVKVLGMAMPGSFLTSRIRQILEGRPAPHLTRARMVCAIAACAIVSVTFAVGAVDHRKPEPGAMRVPAHTMEATGDARVAPPPAPKSLDTRMRPVPRPAALLAQVRTPPPTGPATSTTAQSTKDPMYKDRRLLAMYFDIPAMTDADLARAVGAAQKFIRTEMQPQDVLAIMTYRGGTVRVLQDFSDDRDKLAQTLQQLTAPQSPNSADVSTADRPSAVLRTAIQMLGSLSGKKSLLFFTSGASNGRQSQAELLEIRDALVQAHIAMYPIDSRGLVAEQPKP
jgi:beta-lactamase regulating signal transducer with metallopeptidase domain